MYVFRNVEVTEALRAIMCRNTEENQSDYAEDMQLLYCNAIQHVLFMTHKTGTVIMPEEAVYRRGSPQQALWLRYAQKPGWHALCFAVTVKKRLYGRVRGDIYVLDAYCHGVDIEMNAEFDAHCGGFLQRHLEEIRACREERAQEIPLSGYLKKLEGEFMVRSCAYRAGYRRICREDASRLLREGMIPVYRLTDARYERPLRHHRCMEACEEAVYGIRCCDGAEYEHWQREYLENGHVLWD